MTRSELHENLLVAVDTLRSRKARSLLTILGIVIGVTSVIAVAAIIDGLNGYILNRINSFGSRSFFITRIPPGFTGIGRLPAKIRTRKYLEISDAQYLKENVPGLDVSTAFAQRINLGQQSDSISLRQRACRADDPARHGAGLRRRPAAVYCGDGALHLGVRRGARAARGGDRQRHRGCTVSAHGPHREGGAAERQDLRSDRRFRKRPGAVRRLRRRPVRGHPALELSQELPRSAGDFPDLHRSRRRQPGRRARPGGGFHAAPPPRAVPRRERFRRGRSEFFHQPVEPAHRRDGSAHGRRSARSGCWWAASA